MVLGRAGGVLPAGTARPGRRRAPKPEAGRAPVTAALFARHQPGGRRTGTTWRATGYSGRAMLWRIEVK
jgi:hypothetical protein